MIKTNIITNVMQMTNITMEHYDFLFQPSECVLIFGIAFLFGMLYTAFLFLISR